MRIDCPFLGCKGVVVFSKEFEGFPDKGRTMFLVHTIVCPRCGNPIGGVTLEASTWFNPERRTHTIIDPKSKKPIVIKKTSLNRYLKKWAKTKVSE